MKLVLNDEEAIASYTCPVSLTLTRDTGRPLLTLGSPFKAAEELHLHLDRFSKQSQLLLTVQQLKNLLSRLEPKMTKAGFVDCLLGWHI